MALSTLLQDAAALVTRENQRVVDTIGDKDPLPYRPLISINGAQYFPEPYSSPRLTPGQRVGMIPIASLGTLSVVSTLCLIAFILSRMINWRGHYRTWVGYNQYVVLVLSLLVADLVQGSGFVVSWFWIRIDMILAPSSACFAQGWLLHSGDISSGFFVLAIALHTYYTVVHGKRIGNKTFVGIVVGIWIWSIAITAAGVWMHGSQRYFTAAGSWCWVSPAFETERLWCHYVWIFAIEASTILIYSITFLFLRRKTRQLMAAEANYNNNCTPPGSGSGSSRSRRPETATIQAVNRIARLMVFYPLIYLMLTLPLSAGRMWSMSRGARATGTLYTSIAGALLASCGWVDALLYTATRKRLLKDTMPSSTGSDAASHCCDYSNSNGEIHEECMFSSWNSTTTTEMQQMKQLQKGGSANPHHASLISDDGTIPTTTTTTPTNDFDAMTMTMKMMSSSSPSDRKEIISTSTTASTAIETETIPHELFERKQSQLFTSPPPPATAGAGAATAARERTNSTEPMLSSSPSSASASTSRWGRSFSLSRSKSKSNKNWRMGMGMGRRAGKTAGGSVDHQQQQQQQQQKKMEEQEIFCTTTTTTTAARDDDVAEESFGGDARGNHHHHQLPEDLRLEVVVPTMPLPVYLGEKFELGNEEEEKRW